MGFKIFYRPMRNHALGVIKDDEGFEVGKVLRTDLESGGYSYGISDAADVPVYCGNSIDAGLRTLARHLVEDKKRQS